MQIILLKCTNLKMQPATLNVYMDCTKNLKILKADRSTRGKQGKSLQSGAFLKAEIIMALKPLVTGG